jgi:MGT family glycosyltransferase
MRVLFVTIDGGGNLRPELAMAERLRARGHHVRFLAASSQRDAIEGAGFQIDRYDKAPNLNLSDPATGPVRDWIDDPQTVFTALCDHVWFGPAAAFASDVLDQIARSPVDAIAVDYFIPGGLAAAEKAGVPAVALWHTTFGEWPAWNQGLPALNQARATIGLDAVTDVYDQYRRIDRVLVLTSALFDFAVEPQPMPANVRHVGPQLAYPPTSGAHADHSTASPKVLVSFSTSYQGQESVLGRVIEALAIVGVPALVTTGDAVHIDREAPSNVQIASWVPHQQILANASLTVTHAGMGTVMASMAHGVPLLCMPMGRDQHGNAQRVQHLGVGTVLAEEASPSSIAEAITAVLEDTDMSQRAEAVAATLQAEIARDEAVSEIESLGTRT